MHKHPQTPSTPSVQDQDQDFASQDQDQDQDLFVIYTRVYKRQTEKHFHFRP